MLKFAMKGLNELKRKLKDLERRAKALEGENQVPLSELLTTDFLRRNTQFQTLEELFKASGFSVLSQEDFEKIPDAEWNAFIAKHTRFSNWNQMLEAAVKEWTARQLGL